MSGSRVKRYRGVRQRQWGSWVSEIRHSISKTRVWLGTFETAKEAAKAYDEAARLMEGAAKAKTNFSSSSSSTSLLSPAVKAKLQRCNCLATLQGSAASRPVDKSACSPHSFHIKSSLSVPSSTSSASSSRAHYAMPPPPPGPSSSSSSSKPSIAPRRHVSTAPMVCLRLDNSHEQLGVTWQTSSSSTSASPTSSSSLWFTALPLPAPAPSRQISSPPANLSSQFTAPAGNAAHHTDHLTSLVLPQPAHPQTSVPVSTHVSTLQVNSASYSRHLSSSQLCQMNASLASYSQAAAALRNTNSSLCQVSSSADQVARHVSTDSYCQLSASHVRQVSGMHADSADLLQAALQMGLANCDTQYEEEEAVAEPEVPLNLELAMEQTMMMQQGNEDGGGTTTYGSEGCYSSGSTESSEVEYTNTSTTSTGSQYGQSDGLSSLTAALWYLEQEEEMQAGAGTTSSSGYHVLEEHEGSNARYEPLNFTCSYLPLYNESCQELYEQQLWQ